jgi:transcriptional regulator with XRE-family HTH domain
VSRHRGSEVFKVQTAELLMPLKDRLRELRTAAGLTQQALAFKAGLSVSVVAHIESGRIPDPRLSTLRALAKAMGVALGEFLEEEEKPEAPPAGQGERKKPRKRK